MERLEETICNNLNSLQIDDDEVATALADTISYAWDKSQEYSVIFRYEVSTKKFEFETLNGM